MNSEKLEEFFKTHPTTEVVYEAIGILFLDEGAAQKYLGGVRGHTVITHNRDGGAVVAEMKPLDKTEHISPDDMIDHLSKPIIAGDAEKQPSVDATEKVDGEEKMIGHTVTDEDIENNAELVAAGVKAGDEIQIPEETGKTQSEEVKDAIKNKKAVKTSKIVK